MTDGGWLNYVFWDAALILGAMLSFWLFQQKDETDEDEEMA